MRLSYIASIFLALSLLAFFPSPVLNPDESDPPIGGGIQGCGPSLSLSCPLYLPIVLFDS